MNSFPKISIVTPSFNQDQFLEQTILSVLGQNYPNLEYIIIDGGSTDNSIDIIKKYESNLTYWRSQKDKGQADAINIGFELCTGDILYWLNSDDILMPGILTKISYIFEINKCQIITGDCIHFKESDEDGVISTGSNTFKYFKDLNLLDGDIITQPSTFWTRKTWEKVGLLNIRYNYVFDWEWFIRAYKLDVEILLLNRAISLYRIHDAQKTNVLSLKRHSEILDIYRQFGLTENIVIFNHLKNDRKILKNVFIRIFKRMFLFLKFNISDSQILKFIFPTHYKNITNQKIQNIFYFIGN